MSQRNIDRTNWLGVCLLVIGIAYLNKHYAWDFFHLPHYLPHSFFSWQAILITVGVLLLLFGRSVGLFLILLGAFFWFPDKIFMAFGHFNQWWPAIFVVLGIALLVRSRPVQKN